MSEPIHITDAEFEEKVLKSATPVVVDFWAPWCGPCKMIAPALEDIAKEQGGKVVIAKVNTDDHSKWAAQYDVQGIPTMLFVVNGQVVDRMVGAAPAPVIKQRLEAALAQNQPVAH